MHGPVFLTGMMGSGKTTVARLLAQQTGLPWCDLDRRIEHLFGATTGELMAQGEAVFRAREHVALRTLVAEPGFTRRSSIVATGGGVVVDPDNCERMRRAGVLAFIAVPVAELLVRVGDGGGRPLLTGDMGVRLNALWEERAAAYRAHALEVDGQGAPEAVAARVWAAVRDRRGWES